MKRLGAKVSGSQSEYVLVQGRSFNIKMGGVGLGFGLIIAGFQHGFLGNFGLGENGFFGKFASGVLISFQITPDDATLSNK